MTEPLAPVATGRAAAGWQAARRSRVRVARYAAVGTGGVVVNMAILYVLASRLGWPHVRAAVASGEATILLNFVLNDLWTFGDVSASVGWGGRLLRYHGSACAGLLTTLGVLVLLIRVAGAPYLWANLVGIAAATVVNYGLNLRITWDRAPGAVRSELAMRSEG